MLQNFLARWHATELPNLGKVLASVMAPAIASLIVQEASSNQAEAAEKQPEALFDPTKPSEEEPELAGVGRPPVGVPFLEPEQIQAAADTGKLYLAGPPGSGKSVALATLAHWARSAGWLVSGCRFNELLMTLKCW